jgi:hypothetical protein
MEESIKEKTHTLLSNGAPVFSGTLDECNVEMDKEVQNLERDGGDVFYPGGSDTFAMEYHSRTTLEIVERDMECLETE